MHWELCWQTVAPSGTRNWQKHSIRLRPEGRTAKQGLLVSLLTVLQVARGNFDCMPEDGPRGQRCIVQATNATTSCIDMACSEDGVVLVDGEPCNEGAKSISRSCAPIHAAMCVLLWPLADAVPSRWCVAASTAMPCASCIQ